MRLVKVCVREFKSVLDSNEFDVGDVTCLVGKNEAGKTAVLQALYRLHPIVEKDAHFDVTEDFPRLDVEDYEQDVSTGKRRTQTKAIEATFALTDVDIAPAKAAFGANVFDSDAVTLSRGYDKTFSVNVDVNEHAAVKTLVAAAKLPAAVRKEAMKQQTFATLQAYLTSSATKQQQAYQDAVNAADAIEDVTQKASALEKAKSLQESAEARQLRSSIPNVEAGLFGMYIWQQYLKKQLPKFLYFDEYYQMTGQVNVEKLKERQAENRLENSDHPMLGLLALGRLNLDQLLNPQNTQALKNKLEGASNHLSNKILQYWSQNKHLHVRFDVRPALPGDPAPEMNVANTTNLWGEVYDSAHGATVRLGTRSRGFVWFFSFLAWFSQQRREGIPLILLLDEPGLVLHASAQGDLLRYIEAELKPHHQVIYTTHSPFMVDPKNFDRVRIVRDRSMEADSQLPREKRGSKVFSDILEADPDSLFPLQGALGYDIAQTLFVGPNSLVIEGASDLIYLPVISDVLGGAKRIALNPHWTLTPVGGSGKVQTFVSLLGAQKGLNIATLIDLQKCDQQKIQHIYKKKLLKKKQVLTFADFTGTEEADIEDMFSPDFFLDLVNGAYVNKLSNGAIAVADLTSQHPRILMRLEEYFKQHSLKGGVIFNHFAPARHLAQNIGTLGSKIDSATLQRFEDAFRAVNALLRP